ncbi:MAG: hypothetical protein AAF433_01840 [Bacteroidota bacterium]
MKNLFFLFLTFLILLPACSNDDDDGTNLDNPGDLTLKISWDAADADFDLSILGPTNLIIGGGFVNNPAPGISSSPDVLSGPGEEIIAFDNAAPDGSYFVQLDLASAPAARDVRLEIVSSGTSRTFDESMVDGQTINYSFTKNGGNLNF